MCFEDYFEFLGPDAIRIKGHRLGIEHVIERYREGNTPDDIARLFPGLSLEIIYATLAYYLHNQRELDAYLYRIYKQDEQAYQEWAASPSPLIKRLQAFKAQREQERDRESSLPDR